MVSLYGLKGLGFRIYSLGFMKGLALIRGLVFGELNHE